MSRKKVLIHVDLRVRDAVPMLMLKMQLESRGVSVKLCNRESINTMFYSFLPDVFLQSHIFFDPIDELERKAQIAKLAVLPTEGAVFNPIAIDAHYGGDLKKYNNLFSKSFVWGRATWEHLVRSGYYDEGRVSVVGCPRFDVYRKYTQERCVGDKVGFIGGQALLNIFDRRSLFQMIDSLRDGSATYFDKGRNVEDLYWYYTAQCRILFDIFDKLLLEEKRECVFRPHPNENRAGYDYMKQKYQRYFNLDDGEYFYVWMKKMAGLVMFHSTTAVEAILMQKPFISLEKILGARIDDHINMPDARLPYIQCSCKPQTVKEAVELIKAMSNGELSAKEPNDEIKRVLTDMYDWPRERNSIDQIADEIMDLMSASKKIENEEKSIKLYFRSFTQKLKLMKLYVWRWISYIISRHNYIHDQNYHYFPWNFRDKRDAKRIYREKIRGIDILRRGNSKGEAVSSAFAK